METLTIGRLARLGGVNLETIRYYEHEGLLPEPPRTAAGYSVNLSFVCSRFYVTSLDVVCELSFSIGKFGLCEIEPLFGNGHSLGPFASCLDR